MFIILFTTTRGQAHLACCADRFRIKAEDALAPKGHETVKLLDPCVLKHAMILPLTSNGVCVLLKKEPIHLMLSSALREHFIRTTKNEGESRSVPFCVRVRDAG